MVEHCFINEKKIYAFESQEQILESFQSGVFISLAAESLASKNKEFKDICNNEYSITYSDGEAAVLGLKKAGFKNCVKIPGVDLWLNFLDKYGSDGVMFIGSTTEVVNSVVEKINKNYDNVDILSFRNGFLDEESILEEERKLKKLKPMLVIIAQGQPMQEILASRLYSVHKAIYLCVGGSLDVYSGSVKRAPKLFQNLKLEWLYRLIIQPSRIKRQLMIPSVLFKILSDKNFIKREMND